ncbi:MAG TPA: hypothetical protein PKD05_03815 [Candidatus Melainabacteria bacterium]|nr:hypothetical protein [Candidatus Melainabacteria bacterium]HMP50657.1 hypothetical protein [Candidatus Melainabacteria bacterium]
MSNSSKAPTIVSLSLILLTLIVFARTFQQLPQDWYRPTELENLLGCARVMITVANFYILLLPIICIFAAAALLKRPHKWSWNLLILLLPLIPAEAAHFWGAYCWINKELVTGEINSWTFSTFQNLANLSIFMAIVIAISAIALPDWRGARWFAILVLANEALLCSGTVICAAMASSGNWL